MTNTCNPAQKFRKLLIAAIVSIAKWKIMVINTLSSLRESVATWLWVGEDRKRW